jgi:hypothetical protein
VRSFSFGRCIFAVGISCFLISRSLTVSEAQKINRKLPSVYVTFKEFIAKTPDPAYPSQGARLLIHNNTTWPIIYWTHYDPTVAGEAVIYIIEKQDGSREQRMYVDVVSRGKLMPGKTVSLIVPREDFPKGSQIYVGFNFSWELRTDDRFRDEAVHRAYFLSSDLPAWPAVVAESK